MEKDPKKKRFSLRREFNETFKGLTWKEAKEIGKETLKDLKNPKEALAAATAVIVPGGIIAYPVYRIRKHRKKQKPNNDNGAPPPTT